MGVSKVTYFGKTLMDLTGDTVTPDKLAKGETAHDKSGAAIIGEMLAGGLPSGFTAIATGEYTLSSAVRGSGTFTVKHNLGVVPDAFLIYAPSNVAQTYSMLYALRLGPVWRSGYSNLCGYHGNSSSTVTCTHSQTAYGVKSLTATDAVITTYTTSTSYYWRAGTYKWVAIKF